MRQAYWLCGVLKHALGDIYGGLRDIDTAIMLNFNDPNPYCSRGNIKNELFNFEAAIKGFSISIRLNKNNPLAYCERGMTYLNFEKYDEALVDLSKAIELKPSYGKAYWLRGEVKRIRHLETSCADYTKAAKQECRGRPTLY